MKNNLKIDFQLLGTAVLPKEITSMTGILPDVELIKGERNERLNLPRQNIWSIESRVDSDAAEDHWNSLSLILNKSREEIKEIAKTGQARLTLVINSGQRVPSITIPASMSEFAGFVGAVIDIDHMQ